jgi:group II intron reverse transcriptase/maturase
MSLSTPEKVQKLQAALHAKAKGAPEYRFYALYDKLYREDILGYSYRCCASNGGAAGVDGEDFSDIKAYGVERWLGELAEELRSRNYRPSPIRRVYLPKPDGKERPLGIPTIRDRVVQTAAVLVLSPIFEADMPQEQFGYRPGRGALDAVRKVHALLKTGHVNVVDADVSAYFDSIPHGDLMKSVARRVSDRHMLHLIKQWLTVPVEETDKKGRPHRTTRNKDQGKGIPQGAPISPLLSNLYMRRFVLWWRMSGQEKKYDAHLVVYADDFVVCCRGNGQEAGRRMRTMLERLRLTVNEAKTRFCRVPEDSFDFLGYTIGRCYSPKTGRRYIGTRPSRKRIKRFCASLSRETSRASLTQEVPGKVETFNRMLRGWGNYFCLGSASKAYGAVDAHARMRLRQWLCHKHKESGRGRLRYKDEYLYQKLGLHRLSGRRRNFSWANA